MIQRRVCLVALLLSAVVPWASPDNQLVRSAWTVPAALEPDSQKTSPQTAQSPVLDPIITICSDEHLNQEPAVAYNSLHDEYLVVWSTDENEGMPPHTQGVYAARVGSDGSVGGGFRVAEVSDEERAEPAVAYSPLQDEYLVVYTHYYSDGAEILATRVRWDGSWKSAEISLDQGLGNAIHPTVACNSQDDEYLVVYQTVGYDDDSITGVPAQRVTASDGSLLSYADVAPGVGERRNSPDVAYNPARNEYLITYGFYGSLHPKPYQIRGKVVAPDLDGAAASSEITICCQDASYEPEDVAVAAGPNEYLVVFADTSGPAGDVFARRVSGTGVPQGSSNGFTITTTSHSDRAGQDVAYSPGGRYLVAHSLKMGDKTDMDVHGRYVMPYRDEPSSGKFAIDGSAGYQGIVAAACGPSGDCLVVWEDNRSPAGGKEDFDIRGRFVRLHRLFLPLILRRSP